MGTYIMEHETSYMTPSPSAYLGEMGFSGWFSKHDSGVSYLFTAGKWGSEDLLAQLHPSFYIILGYHA